MNSNLKEVVKKLQIPSQTTFQAIVVPVPTQSITMYKTEIRVCTLCENTCLMSGKTGGIKLVYFSFLCKTRWKHVLAGICPNLSKDYLLWKILWSLLMKSTLGSSWILL